MHGDSIDKNWAKLPIARIQKNLRQMRRLELESVTYCDRQNPELAAFQI
jgi:hypothetical protein